MGQLRLSLAKLFKERLIMTPPKTTNPGTYLYFQTRDELTKIEIQKVVYFESDGNYTKVSFVNGCNILVLTSLSNIEKLLDDRLAGKVQPFIRIGKRYVINSKFIFNINIQRQRLILTDCVHPTIYTLNVSKEALKSIKNLFTEKTLWKS